MNPDYKPTFVEVIKDGKLAKVLYKHEKDDGMFYVKKKSLSMRVDELKQCEFVIVYAEHRNLYLCAPSKDILDFNDIQDYGEYKAYYPIDRWAVMYDGDPNWHEKINWDAVKAEVLGNKYGGTAYV